VRRDAVELDRFYRTRKGMTAQRMILRRLHAIWPNAEGLDVLGLGFPTPFLESYRATARRCVSLMPAGQGAVVQSNVLSTAALGDETHLPFPEAVFDRVLLVHAIEEADALAPLLREIWRVLAPQGRILIVAASRSGIWARLDSTPFGHGRPFSRSQLTQLLDGALFEPTAWSRALYAPPWNWSTGKKAANIWEQTGESFWPGLGAIVLAEAVKRTAALSPRSQGVLKRKNALEAQPVPALSPQRHTIDNS
jgi:SAM-dependent methyltransferase